ncbi:LysE/ArgO family amino acid transporter [Roseobacter sp. HKCCA0434]|uniref:LysE/ArgO family amino acid transporter n=1 Tax=Roseobacter sp. HKCCA0434 TaxID=3079297 RepID=UPI00290593CC|nr:LysE/ArgO family amino acid transporter [Roseobacter sp. HKCCA0434]
MIEAILSGFGVGLGLILAIGAQNAFVLRQGLRGEHVFFVALTCAASDALLIAAGVAGFGAIAEAVPWLEGVFRWGGALFLFLYGLRSFHAALTATGALTPADAAPVRLWPVLATCLALTWLNPHVYLDTLVLVGSVSTEFGDSRWWFGAGAISASFVFFFSLAYGARLLRPIFARPSAWRVLDAFVGGLMWVIAASLVL